MQSDSFWELDWELELCWIGIEVYPQTQISCVIAYKAVLVLSYLSVTECFDHICDKQGYIQDRMQMSSLQLLLHLYIYTFELCAAGAHTVER